MNEETQNIERWECNACSDPCRIEAYFEYTDDHIIVNPRFTGMRICREPSPVWRRVENNREIEDHDAPIGYAQRKMCMITKIAETYPKSQSMVPNIKTIA